MIDFIVALTAHARETNPNFFVILQNGAFILSDLGNDPARRAALLDAVGAIAVEDVFLRGGSNAENNGYLPDADTIEVLQNDFLANGKPVFSVDYVNKTDLTEQFLSGALSANFIPTVAPTRGLDQSFAPLRALNATTETADLVAGTAGADTIRGKGGNDTLFGFAGSDTLLGDGGNDTLSGGAANDQLSGGIGADTLNGGAGFDCARYDDANYGSLIVSLTTSSMNSGAAKGDTFAAIEGLIGGIGNDALYGDGQANVLIGGAGRDTLTGYAGNDIFYIDRSDDVVREAANAGIDTVVASSSFVLSANVERLTLTGTANTSVWGNTLSNVLTGNTGANLITGGAGRDFLTGGAGADRFDFNAISETGKTAAARDVISDFVHLSDLIDLSTIDANGALAGNAFIWRAAAAFSGRAGDLHVRYENSAGTINDKTIVEGDTNGDRVADFQIELKGLITLTAKDFVL